MTDIEFLLFFKRVFIPFVKGLIIVLDNHNFQ